MSDKKVIHPTQLPTRLPLWSTVVVYLLMERLESGAVAWAIVGTLMVMVWLGCFLGFVTERWVKIDLK